MNAFARGARTGVADDPDALGSEHLVKRLGELAVAVADQEPDRRCPLDKRFDDVP
jgi:hypothetical protein